MRVRKALREQSMMCRMCNRESEFTVYESYDKPAKWWPGRGAGESRRLSATCHGCGFRVPLTESA